MQRPSVLKFEPARIVVLHFHCLAATGLAVLAQRDNAGTERTRRVRGRGDQSRELAPQFEPRFVTGFVESYAGSRLVFEAPRQNLWVESAINLTIGPQLRLDRGGPPLAPLPSHQPSTAGRRADVRATAEGLTNSYIVYK